MNYLRIDLRFAAAFATATWLLATITFIGLLLLPQTRDFVLSERGTVLTIPFALVSSAGTLQAVIGSSRRAARRRHMARRAAD